ncbi:E3 ubiquitin-protein ligase [Haematococcus lacustris]|uniref:E3 ubiquitin-protein ligase n=1 Tax=Haematococcus lacustris TaxID=44745 RepID=A0A6A0A7P7_HAELA|nr:E3 ubiquitin-protein ligase [Haematococcus lacustris]
MPVITQLMFPPQVQDALRKEGLESSNLVLAIDYTGSNEWTGKNSFGGRCLHALGQESNPYELAISIIGRTLAAFDEDNLIPTYGFGDVGSKDSRVFSFHEGDQPCHGLDSVLWRYKVGHTGSHWTAVAHTAPPHKSGTGVFCSEGLEYELLIGCGMWAAYNRLFPATIGLASGSAGPAAGLVHPQARDVSLPDT